MHRNFKEAQTIKTPFSADAIYGGQLLGVRSQDFICFYDWATGKVGVRAWGWLGCRQGGCVVGWGSGGDWASGKASAHVCVCGGWLTVGGCACYCCSA